MDKFSPQVRSEIMKRIKGKNTQPELRVRRIIYALGYRYRLHAPELPGKPDIVFRGRKKVIFVNGCFWHQHKNCKLAPIPKTRVRYWTEKLARNKERDKSNVKRLRDRGWAVLVVWECELKNEAALTDKLERFLEA